MRLINRHTELNFKADGLAVSAIVGIRHRRGGRCRHNRTVLDFPTGKGKDIGCLDAVIGKLYRAFRCGKGSIRRSVQFCQF